MNGKEVTTKIRTEDDTSWLTKEDENAQLFPFVSGCNVGANIEVNCGERGFVYPLDSSGSVASQTEEGKGEVQGVADFAMDDLPVLVAAKKKHWHTVEASLKAVISNGLCDEKDLVDGRTLLWLAAEAGQSEIVTRLVLEGRANVGLADNKGVTPIWATRHGCQDVVKMLRDHGAKFEILPPGKGKILINFK